MAIFLLSALLLAGQAASTTAPRGSRPVTVVNDQEFDLNPLGGCVTRNGRRIDMRRVGFLEDRPLEFDAPGGPFRAWVQGQKLLIEATAANSDHSTYFNRIDYQVAEDGGGNLDLEIKLAFVEGRLAVYWRETYRNRIYRQGFYAIVGQGVEYLCAGRGGIRVDD